ncbi:hypothetical protein F5Y15DRAFT_264612 [Xylariaceae sp. FL0016]|nr:hypothetical protein F5Y15DRAFT_264612 [Xylariaceae sp. FL0016]
MKGRCVHLVLLAVLGALRSFGYAKGLGKRGNDIPSNGDFIRRSCQAVAVIGDYVYIDGGGITEKSNSSDPSGSSTFAVNSTLSISLKESWTNETVQFWSIEKTAPSLNKQVFWTEESTNSLYTWAGSTYGNDLPPNELWTLAADDDGGGTWSQVTQRDYIDFSRLVRPVGAAFATVGDVGYAFGGTVTAKSDNAVPADSLGYAIQGVVSYNFQTGEWNNASSASYGGYGTSLNANAQVIPYGPNNLILFLGGAESPTVATNETIVQTSWNMVTLFDPVTQQWYTQGTSGTKPPTMESACTVGVQGPNGTYEIFIYGGVSDQIRDTSGDVHVLSLPAFTFFKSDVSGPPRSEHGCAVIGKGKRQMLSVGGVDGANRTFVAPATPDPWTQGIGIYDMVEMNWRDSYDPDAPDYESPSVVQEWYTQGGLQNMKWDSEDLESFFNNGSITTMGNATDSQASTATTNIGAIVGATVGGVTGVAIIGAAAWYFRKKRRNSQSKALVIPDSMVEQHQDGIAEYRPEPWPKDIPRYMSPVSHLTDGTAVEIAGTWRGELPDHEADFVGELPGTEGYRGELPGEFGDWTHELPAPLSSPRQELPDRKYSV